MVVCCNKPLIIALALLSAGSSLAFSSTKSITTPRGLSLSSLSSLAVEEQQQIIGIDRPLLRQFGNRISERVINSKYGYNWKDTNIAVDDGYDAYTSEETIPCLNMQSDGGSNNTKKNDGDIASRGEIRKAYTASSSKIEPSEFGRSSGSGCTIIRLRGKDASSVNGLVNFADDFFDGVDNEECNTDINNVGMVRVDDNVHFGFDTNVNGKGKMQVLYTKLVPSQNNNEEQPLMLPKEVGELVGIESLSNAHDGMEALFDIGSQITSAVLGMTVCATNKLLDDCTASRNDFNHEVEHHSDNVANSYQRLIRYLKPLNNETVDTPAFWPHVDSTFLTMIPMPKLPGLEVWCPSKKYATSDDMAERGEWVRPIIPFDDDYASSIPGKNEEGDDDCAYVIVLSGEFLQLLSDGSVPACIHRVIPPKSSSQSASSSSKQKYKPRVSAPLFIRPRRRKDAILNVASDLNNALHTSTESDDRTSITAGSEGLYFEEGLMEECDNMHVWEYMSCMSIGN